MKVTIIFMIFIATMSIISCSQKPNVVVEPPSQTEEPNLSKTELTKQRAKKARTPKREKPISNVQSETVPQRIERKSKVSPEQEDFSNSLPRLTTEQKAQGWVDAIGECYQGRNMTTEEARRYALEKAKRNAIEQTLGVEVQAQTLHLKLETSQDFHQSFTELSQTSFYGKIIEQKKPLWKLENIQFPDEPPIPCHRVFLRVKVAKEKGKKDPSFNVTLKLNGGRETFFEGDEIVLRITPTQDCYITVLNVLSDNTMLILFPPKKGQTPEKVSAGRTLLIPSETERRKGIHFRVGLLPGKRRDTESLIVIATKDDIPFLPREPKEFRPDIKILSGKVVLPSYQSALEEVNRWLVSIPLSQRAFDMQQYHIRKK